MLTKKKPFFFFFFKREVMLTMQMLLTNSIGLLLKNFPKICILDLDWKKTKKDKLSHYLPTK